MARNFITAAVLAAASSVAMAVPPSDASLEELLAVTRAADMVDLAAAAAERSIDRSVAQAAANAPAPSEERRRAQAAFLERGKAILREEMSWTTMKPVVMSVYRESFDQVDIDGILAFYKSPAGQSYVAKMPAVIEKTMQMMQAQMAAMQPKLEAAMRESMRGLPEQPAR